MVRNFKILIITLLLVTSCKETKRNKISIDNISIESIKSYCNTYRKKNIENCGCFLDSIPLKINDNIIFIDLVVNPQPKYLDLPLDSNQYYIKKIYYKEKILIGFNKNTINIMDNEKKISLKELKCKIRENKTNINRYDLYIIIDWKKLKNKNNQVIFNNFLLNISKMNYKTVLEYKNKNYLNYLNFID